MEWGGIGGWAAMVLATLFCFHACDVSFLAFACFGFSPSFVARVDKIWFLEDWALLRDSLPVNAPREARTPDLEVNSLTL